MNASLQSIFSLPEVRSVCLLDLSDRNSTSSSLVRSVQHLFKSMADDINSEKTIPVNVLSNLHKKHPSFAERTSTGIFAQQDAEECFSALVEDISLNIPAAKEIFSGTFHHV